jgi:hypothetical protein
MDWKKHLPITTNNPHLLVNPQIFAIPTPHIRAYRAIALFLQEALDNRPWLVHVLVILSFRCAKIVRVDAHLVSCGREVRGDFFVHGVHVLRFVGCALGF